MGWKINGVPHTGQILTVGPSGRDFTNPRDAFSAAADGALVLLDPGTYPSATKDSTDHIYEWHTKKIYWRGLGDAPSDTVLDVNTYVYGMMISAKDMLFENLQFNPTSFGMLRYSHPITTGLILNKCKITNDREQCQYSVASWWADDAQIIDGGIKFINVDFPDTDRGVFTGQSDYPALLSKIYVSKCIIPDNDPNGYYLTGTYALLDYVTSPTEGYGSNYGAYLITETQYSYLKNRRSRFDTFGRVLDVMEPCIRYLPFRGRDRFFNQGGRALNNRWLDGWSYRKWVTVSRASGAVTNYQMKLLVGESSGATGENVDCGGKCLSTFNDLRFTKADGITLLDYWIESISGTTPNQLATVWIEFDSIGTDATTFYMYYGKADAAAVSNGANTFIAFDDFERGADGDTIGGDWTESTAHVHISTEQKYAGSKSAKLIGGTEPVATYSITPTDNMSIQWRAYKENATNYLTFMIGNGTKRIAIYYGVSETIFYLNSAGAFSSSLGTATADTWHLFEINNIVWENGAFDLYVDGNKIGNICIGYGDSFAANVLFFRGSDTSNQDSWIDNVIVRNYESTEPAWGSWGTEEAL